MIWSFIIEMLVYAVPVIFAGLVDKGLVSLGMDAFFSKIIRDIVAERLKNRLKSPSSPAVPSQPAAHRQFRHARNPASETIKNLESELRRVETKMKGLSERLRNYEISDDEYMSLKSKLQKEQDEIKDKRDAEIRASRNEAFQEALMPSYRRNISDKNQNKPSEQKISDLLGDMYSILVVVITIGAYALSVYGLMVIAPLAPTSAVYAPVTYGPNAFWRR
ncbi:MAG: hypothetical protein WCO00_10775 [Rhodospirillaceae bacterium]